MLTTEGEGLPFFRLLSGIIEGAEGSGLPLKFRAPFLSIVNVHWVEDEASFPFLFPQWAGSGLSFPPFHSLTTSLSCFKASSGLPPSVE